MKKAAQNKSLRPKMVTVFVAAFLAGGTAAVGVNRFIDVTRTRSKATVECEPIFVAIRDLPAGDPVTVWDVKLRDWPKAMVPQAALRPGSFDGIAWPEGHVARLSLREGQPVLRSHLRSAVVEVHPSVPQPVAVATPVATTTPETVLEPPAMDQPPAIARAPAVEKAEPLPESSAATAPAAVADSSAVATTASSPTVVAPTEQPTTTETEQPKEQPAETAPSLVETKAADSATNATETAVASSPTPSEAETGEGWPTAAETAAGSEAAMRFLVVPERIAIMADELTSPRKPEPPSTPVATVATQPKQVTQPKQAARQKPTEPSRPAAAPNQQAATPSSPSPTKKSTAHQTMPKAKYPGPGANSMTQAGQGSQPPRQPMQQKSRPTPPSPDTRRQPAQASPSTNGRPASPPTPRVTVEPDPESDLADEAARTPILKSVFPNMSAGIEKIESEVSRFRRERFGSLFRPTDGPEGEEPDDSDATAPSIQWLPSFRYR